MAENMQVELLNDAFNVFREASHKLEQQYALLERKVEELNEELAEKNRAMERSRRLAAMGEMAAKIAHEIRNPLGSIAIFAGLLERGLKEDPDKHALAGHITKGVKTLDNILSNMLLFAGAPDARLRPVDIREVIEDSLTLTRGHDRGGVEVVCAYDGPTTIHADPGMLGQMFINIFLNAIDAMNGSGRLEVRTRPADGGRSMEVFIKDSGSGIPEEHLDRVFDPFFSTKDRGTGLGLAIVAAVASAHHGSIKVRSAAGMGTEFTILLPAGEECKA